MTINTCMKRTLAGVTFTLLNLHAIKYNQYLNFATCKFNFRFYGKVDFLQRVLGFVSGKYKPILFVILSIYLLSEAIFYRDFLRHSGQHLVTYSALHN